MSIYVYLIFHFVLREGYLLLDLGKSEAKFLLHQDGSLNFRFRGNIYSLDTPNPRQLHSGGSMMAQRFMFGFLFSKLIREAQHP